MQLTTLDQRYTPTTTDNYATIKTSDIITMLEGNGFKLVDFQAKRISKKKQLEGRNGYQAHIATLEFTASEFKHPQGMPRVIVTNSHDGTKALQFHIGFIRFACSNGLIVGENIVPSLRVRHQGNVQERVKEVVEWAVAAVKKMIDTYNAMSNVQLTSAQVLEFTNKAAKLRGLDNVIALPIRDADQSNDLFTVYNRVQEALIKGGNKAFRNGQETKRKLTAVRSPLIAQKINTDLSDIAATYLNIAA